MKIKQLSITMVGDSSKLEWIYEFVTAHGEPDEQALLELGKLVKEHTIAIAIIAEPSRDDIIAPPPGSANPNLN